MWDESCPTCGQPFAHLFGCPIKPTDRFGSSWKCPDTFPTDWLHPDPRVNELD